MLIHCLACAAVGLAQPPIDSPPAVDLPLVILEHDNTAISRSCRLLVPEGLIIPDADHNGVIHITADGITIEWAAEQPGGTLQGAPPGAPPETITGVGIRIDGRTGVTIRGLRLHRYKHAVWATNADDLAIENCDISDGYAMRLGSTPAAEDSADWLWPHANDNNEWATNYGGAIWIEDSKNVTVAACFARRTQNALILENVTDSRIHDNDFSFLSGWGIAMWRSSRNAISRNALDFCIRGYSHGVYNRGQDSAGILLFEQCSKNLFAENSATHGGDGLFGFGGKEALGDTPAPETDADGAPWTYARRGCNDNVFIGNDFSYAAAHGLELTFSFGNAILNNRFVENAICGIWGGYSQDTNIQGNEFRGNGGAGYGLERGGVNIEHSERNVIAHNRFEHNAAGVHLWHDADPGLMSGRWAAANHQRTRDNTISGNSFHGDTVGIHLRTVEHTLATGNTFVDVATPILEEQADSTSAPSQLVTGDGREPVQITLAGLGGLITGDSRPVGARAHLAGRHNIIMGEYFPWDHTRPMVRRAPDQAGAHVYQVLGVEDPSLLTAATDRGSVAIKPAAEPIAQAIAPALPHVQVIVAPDPDADVTAYSLALGGAVDRTITGLITRAAWDVRCFRSTVDPREDLAGWRAAADSGIRDTAHALRLRFGHGGPTSIRGQGFNLDEVAGDPPGADHFGTIATTTLRLPPGRWRITTLSDDGVRVIVNDQTLIENWTWHGPTRDTGEFEIASSLEGHLPPPTTILVEHFELDGYAVLELEIEPVSP